jgi:hypothetical protein
VQAESLTPIYLYEGKGQKVHERNKNASDDLQRIGRIDTNRLARFTYTILVMFCQEKAGPSPKGSADTVAAVSSIKNQPPDGYLYFTINLHCLPDIRLTGN